MLKVVLAIFLFLGSMQPANLLANPQGHSVVSGDVQLTEAGHLLELQTSNKAIINWESFSIQIGEITRFIQPSELSSILNRVTGSEMSEIMGKLHSNGKVYLVNPNGVVIGKEGRIDTAAFVATCLDIKNVEFLNGEALKIEGDETGKIINLGTVETQSGPLTLIAHKIENSGRLIAHKGTASLLSGHEVLIDKTGEGILFIRPDLPSEGIDNSGKIEALKVKLESDVSPAALAIGLGGIVEANAIEEIGGEIYLVAKSGSIEVQSEGRLRASEGGQITVHAEEERVIMNGGVETPFGQVRVLGKSICLGEESLIDVSSDFGGGEVLIGGDFQGNNPNIQNADITWVQKGARIKADAWVDGNGGRIICWADNRTAFHGSLSGRGGEIAGDGGFAEVSGKNGLNFDGLKVDLRAPFGKTGQILFDPSDITISTGAQDPAWTNPFNPGPSEVNPSIANTTEVQNALALADVTISTSNGDQGSGTITIANDLTWSSANKLTLTTTKNIIVSSGVTISNTNNGAINFDAMEFTATGAVAAGYVGILVQGTITSRYGNISLTGTGGNADLSHGIQITTGGTITSIGTGVPSASITLNGTGGTASFEVGVDMTVANAVTAVDGAISITGQGGGNATAASSPGVQIAGVGTFISSTGLGTITIGGTGGPGTGGSNEGVVLTADISTVGGDISITGVGGTGVSAAVDGIAFGIGTISSTDSGNITLHGTGGASATSGGNGLDLTTSGSGAISSSSTGSVTLTGIDQEGSYNGIVANGIDIGGATSGTVTLNTDTINLFGGGTISGTGALVIQPVTASQDINIATGSGGLDIASSELLQIQSGFSSITIGKSDGSGTVTIGAYTFDDPLVLRGGPIDISGAVSVGLNSITLTSNNGLVNVANSLTGDTDTVTINVGQVSAGTLTLGASISSAECVVNGSAQDNTYNLNSSPGVTTTITEVSGTNTYNVNAASLPITINVGSGTDTLDFADTATVTAVSLANGGTNTFDYRDYTSAISVNLQGGTATGITTVTSISELDVLQGSTTANGTLTGLNATNAWAVSGANSGTYVSGGDTLTFSNIANLTTGTGSDTITFSDAQAITGSISFTAGTANVVNYSAYTTAVSINLEGGTATGTGGISNTANITSIIGSGLTGSSGDSLTGPSGTATWTMDNSTNDKGVLTYGASTTAYEGISNYTGGTGTDTFVIKQGTVTTGVIDAGNGGDVLDYSDFTTTSVTVDFTSDKATNIFTSTVGAVGADNGVLNFHEVGVGSDGTITGGSTTIVTGHNGQTNTWTVDGAKSGKVVNALGTTNFTSTGTLTLNGGNSTDNFTVTATGTVDTINGGSGTNSLTYLLVQNNTWNITDNNDGNIDSVVTFTDLQNLTGGPRSDTFVLSDQKGVSGTIDGGSIDPNPNTLDYSNYTTAIEYDLTAGTATNIGAITRIQTVIEPTLPETPALPPVVQQAVVTSVTKQDSESDLDESKKVTEGTLETPATPNPKTPCRSPGVSVQAF